MTPEKQAQLLRGQSANAQKVFDQVPIQEWYTLRQIATAVHRVSMARVSLNVLQGCLAALSNAGLIRLRNDTYQRTAVSAGVTRPTLKLSTEEPIQTPKESTMTTQAATTKKAVSPIELCAGIAAKMRDLAVDVENLGLALEESSQADKEQLQQFAQFKALLGSLK